MVRYYSPPPFDLRPLEAWGPSIIIEDIGASTSQTFQTNVFLHCPCVSNLCVSALSGPCVTQGLVLSQVVTMGAWQNILASDYNSASAFQQARFIKLAGKTCSYYFAYSYYFVESPLQQLPTQSGEGIGKPSICDGEGRLIFWDP